MLKSNEGGIAGMPATMGTTTEFRKSTLLCAGENQTALSARRLVLEGIVMVGKCANSWCPATRHHHEGKLFRLDIDLGNKAGETEQKTDYVWLCGHCAQEMHPTVDVTGDTVTVKLSRNVPVRVAVTNRFSARVH
jgi:hypothetical protein